jgi:hypothetical protein
MMVSFLSHLHGFLFACHFTQLGLDALPSDKELPPAGTTRTSVQSPQRQTVQVQIMLSIEVLLVVGVIFRGAELVYFLHSYGLVLLCSLFAVIGMILLRRRLMQPRNSIESAYFEVHTEDSFLQHHTHMIDNAEQGLELAETEVYRSEKT